MSLWSELKATSIVLLHKQACMERDIELKTQLAGYIEDRKLVPLKKGILVVWFVCNKTDTVHFSSLQGMMRTILDWMQ